MTQSVKKRRSERIPAAHRLMIIIQGPSGAAILKEIVSSVEISRHGALILGRRQLERDWTGTLLHLSSCRQVPFRVAYQRDSGAQAGTFETGIEILAGTDFWGRGFADYAPPPTSSDIIIENASVTPAELLDELRRASVLPEGERMLEILWCALVEQLEERGVFSRRDLIESLRKLASATAPR